jgi:phage terminase large subunit (gpA)
VKKKRIVKLEPQTVELFAEVLSKLRPPPPLTVSQWADRYRVLSAESSAEPGRWHTEKAPYQRAIMDAIGDPHVRSVVVMSAAQIGKTDAFILNPLGYYMDYAPCPVMCMSFAVNELFPAVSPLISMIISLVGTTLINAIKLVVDVIHGLLPVIEPVIQGIVGLIKGIVSVTITVANAIIGTLNKLSFTVPDWVPALGGKQFGFNLKEVAMPAFANGGFTHGVSIAGEAGTEAVISFKPSVHDSNVENWVRAGRMLGVSGEDATRAAGVRYFANGGFTDGSKEKLDNLIDFSKAYGKYALRSNGIRTTGDALSMLWTVANNSMSGDASLALAATSLAADVAPLLLNKYLGSDSPVTTALTEAAKNYNGGTVLSSWQDGVLTDTGTPLYVLPPRDTGRTLSEIPVSAYQNTPVPGGNGGSSPQFVFAPNITITGDADRQQIASIMEDEYEKFKAFMDKYNRENNRTRYA